MTKKSKGMGFGIALGAALGAALGVMAGHVAIWLAVGVAIGFAIAGAIPRNPIDCPECAAVHREHERRSVRQEVNT